MAKKKMNTGAPSSAAATRRPSKPKSGTGWRQHLLSLVALLAAVALTFLLTWSPQAAPPVEPEHRPRRTKREAGVEKTPAANMRCRSRADGGECDTNPELMGRECPSTCAAKKAPPKPAAPVVAKKAPPGTMADTHESCALWASQGECDSNPTYMKTGCATSCATIIEGAVPDIHQDCQAWVSDGECFRNPAFMLQQCKTSCQAFAESNENILQDTSDVCVNFALTGGCETDLAKASTVCRASCHIQRICGNHTETVYCQKALRCEAITDRKPDCAVRAAKGFCASEPTTMLKDCLKSCSEADLAGLMHFHLPHSRTILSPRIDLPGSPPHMAGFYSTPPSRHNYELNSRNLCSPRSAFSNRLQQVRLRASANGKWNSRHWHAWGRMPGRETTPRVPHLHSEIAADPGSDRRVVVEHIAFSPRIRYLHKLLTAEECEHVIKIATPLFSRSPVRGSVTRVRTSTTAMLGGGSVGRDPVVQAIRHRIARFSGYSESMIEPLQVVRYQQGQKYDGHHDFFDVCDVEDKAGSGRRQITFLIYLVAMPEGEEGGGTAFPDLKLEVNPEQGSAIVFNDCFDNGEEDSRSLHAGLAPKNPNTLKFAINGWIRSHRVGHMYG